MQQTISKIHLKTADKIYNTIIDTILQNFVCNDIITKHIRVTFIQYTSNPIVKK